MDRITLPKNSTDSFITLLIYSDRGAMIAVENITEIQSYVGSTESRDFNKSFRLNSDLDFRFPEQVPLLPELYLCGKPWWRLQTVQQSDLLLRAM